MYYIKGQGPGLVNVLFAPKPSNSFTRLDLRTMTSASVAAFGVIILCSVLTRVHLTQATHAPEQHVGSEISGGRQPRICVVERQEELSAPHYARI